MSVAECVGVVGGGLIEHTHMEPPIESPKQSIHDGTDRLTSKYVPVSRVSWCFE